MSTEKYINESINRILKYTSREEQNEQFRHLTDNPKLEPIRMTLTTAVFKYNGLKQPVILKRIIFNPSNDLYEDTMSLGLKHPHICKALKAERTYFKPDDGGETQLIIWVFFEYLDVKVSHRIVNRNEQLIRKILEDALKGLQHMHSLHIAHLDIKIGNIMGKNTNNGVVYKLIDFGYSQFMDIGGPGYMVIEKKNFGTYPYKAPEVVLRSEHGLKSDVWSIGAVAWFLSLPHMPFYMSDGYTKDLPSYRRFLKEKTGSPETRNNHEFKFDKNTSAELKDFVQRCMRINPNARPTVVELLEHPFIKGERMAPPETTGDEYTYESSRWQTTTNFETYE